MNEHQITLMDNLSAFNEIITKGERVDSEYQLSGVKAWHDYDGYTCYIGYKDLTLTLLFHGKLSMDYQDKKTLAEFYHKIKKILKAK
ncbi:MAG: DUF3081 family protein [Kangiellaceae bacterium]|jgi:hypothetical protein